MGGVLMTYSRISAFLLFLRSSASLAPRVGLEPTTTRLTAECSTIELSRNNIKEGPTQWEDSLM